MGDVSIDSRPDAIARGLPSKKPSGVSSVQPADDGDREFAREFGSDERLPDVHCKVSSSR